MYGTVYSLLPFVHELRLPGPDSDPCYERFAHHCFERFFTHYCFERFFGHHCFEAFGLPCLEFFAYPCFELFGFPVPDTGAQGPEGAPQQVPDPAMDSAENKET